MRFARTLAATAMIITAGPTLAQSLDEMAGQMIVVGFQGNSVDETAGLRAEIAAGEVGGVMYLGTNIGSLKTVKAMNTAFLGRQSRPAAIHHRRPGGWLCRAAQRLQRFC